MIVRKIALLSLLPALILLFTAADKYNNPNLSESASAKEAKWVDSVFAALTLEEKIGQLIVIRGNIDDGNVYEQQIEESIRKYKPGGVCLFNRTHKGSVEHFADMVNRWQAASPQLPLMVSLDAETGAGMRLRESVMPLPNQLTLGAIQDNNIIYDYGREVARQLRRLGVHVNYAPVCDINNNPLNPVINDRSFGEDRENVTEKARYYMQGLQDGGIMACAKHFPGHGDTHMDSHNDLPPIPYNQSRLDSLELYPFRALVDAGVGSVMVGHLSVPAFDDRLNRPTSLSAKVINGLLRRDLYFRGLIFTDGLGMEGVNKHFKPGESDVEALVAGNDVLLLPVNLDSTLLAVKRALNSGYLPQKQFETSVLRVLRAKYRLDLTKPQQVKTENLRSEINTGKALALKYKIFANATVLLRDLPGLIGMENTEQLRIATLAIGDSNRTVFQTYCNYYAPMVHFNTPKKINPVQSAFLLDTLKTYDVVLLSFHSTRSRAVDSFGLNWSQRALVSGLNQSTNLVATYFGNPYALQYLDTLPVLMLAHTEDPIAQQVAAQNIFGALDIKGKLPVTISERLSYLHGVDREFFRKRLAYAPPETVGMNSDTLRLMDDLARDLIANGAAPGCQVLVVKDNRVVWNKAYGNYTYEPNAPPVSTETIYDLASITKVAATTLSLMLLKDKGQFALDENMSRYIPELKKTDKEQLKVREILAHHAGLEAWIPFYQQTLTADKMPDSTLYQKTDTTGGFVPVAKDFYLRKDYVDTIWNKIFNSKLNPAKGYKYADLGLYLGARAVQNITNQSVDEFAKENFYIPMGMSTMTYNPWKLGWESRCAPTEEDGYFRRQRLQGYVHDMGAAMLGGVSGHAGLFSNANDLAKVFQMLLNGGVYGNREYLDKKTVQEFTTRFAGSTRRGIGFDMKETNASQTQNMSPLAGPNSFGHMGFTGNSVWADPDSKLIVVFLSNRTYPTMENNKLSNGDYRPKMQGIAYRALGKK